MIFAQSIIKNVGRPLKMFGLEIARNINFTGRILTRLQKLPNQLKNLKGIALSLEATTLIRSQNLTRAIQNQEITDELLPEYHLTKIRVNIDNKEIPLIVSRREARLFSEILSQRIPILYEGTVVLAEVPGQIEPHGPIITPWHPQKTTPTPANKAVLCKRSEIISTLVNALVNNTLVATANLPVGRVTRVKGQASRESRLNSPLGKDLLSKYKEIGTPDSEELVIKQLEELEEYNFSVQTGSVTNGDRKKFETAAELIINPENHVQLRKLAGAEAAGRSVMVLSDQDELLNMWLLANPEKTIEISTQWPEAAQRIIRHAARYGQFEIGTYDQVGGMLCLTIDSLMSTARTKTTSAAAAFNLAKEHFFRDFEQILANLSTGRELPTEYQELYQTFYKNLANEKSFLQKNMGSNKVFVKNGILFVMQPWSRGKEGTISRRAIYEFLDEYNAAHSPSEQAHLAVSFDEAMAGAPWNWIIGVNPKSPRASDFDLRALWLVLATAENQKRVSLGMPPLSEKDGNWGGHEAAGGSPKDIQTVLDANDLVAAIGKIPTVSQLKRAVAAFRARSHTLDLEKYIGDRVPQRALEALEAGMEVVVDLHHGPEAEVQKQLSLVEGHRELDVATAGAKQRWHFEEKTDANGNNYLHATVTNILGYTKLEHLILYSLYSGMKLGRLHDYGIDYDGEAQDVIAKLRTNAQAKGHQSFARTVAIGSSSHLRDAMLQVITARALLAELQTGTAARGDSLLAEVLANYQQRLATAIINGSADFSPERFDEFKTNLARGARRDQNGNRNAPNPLAIYKGKLIKKIQADPYILPHGIVTEQELEVINRMTEEQIVSLLHSICERFVRQAPAIASAIIAQLSENDFFGVVSAEDFRRYFDRTKGPNKRNKQLAQNLEQTLIRAGYINSSGVILVQNLESFSLPEYALEEADIKQILDRNLCRKADLTRVLSMKPEEIEAQPSSRYVVLGFKRYVEAMQKGLIPKEQSLISTAETKYSHEISANNDIFKAQLLTLPNGESVILLNISLVFGDLAGYLAKAAAAQAEVEQVIFLGNSGILQTRGAEFGVGTNVYPSHEVYGTEATPNSIFNAALGKALRDGEVLDLGSSQDMAGQKAQSIQTCHAVDVQSPAQEDANRVDNLKKTGVHSVELEAGPILRGLNGSGKRVSIMLYASDFPGEEGQSYATVNLGGRAISDAIDRQTVYLLDELERPVVRVRQMAGAREITSPLVFGAERHMVIKEAVAAGQRVYTVDFSLGRETEQLGLEEKQIDQLLADNLDHHDGKNPGRCATEIALDRLDEFVGSSNHIVLSDTRIDQDNILSTFVVMNPNLAREHEAIIRGAARYSDFPGVKVSKEAEQLALTLETILKGSNAFATPVWELNQHQKAMLFNEIMREIPLILTSPEKYVRFYQAAQAELAEQQKMLNEQPEIIELISSNVAVVRQVGIERRLLYQSTDAPIVISVKEDEEAGKFHYLTVGLNKRLSHINLTGLWENLRSAENTKRESLGLQPLARQDNWGGSEEAGGSPKDKSIGSVLTPQEVASVVERFLLNPEAAQRFNVG